MHPHTGASTYVHTCKHTHRNTRTHVHAHAHMHTYIRVYTRTQVCTPRHTHALRDTDVRVHTPRQPHAHTHTHTPAQKRTHAHTWMGAVHPESGSKEREYVSSDKSWYLFPQLNGGKGRLLLALNIKEHFFSKSNTPGNHYKG